MDWETDFDVACARSLQERRPIFIDVIKDPCAGCAKLEAETFPDTAVNQALLDRFVLLKLDLFKSPRAVIRPLNVIWTPTLLFADRRGTVHYRSVNFLPPDLFLTVLDIGESHVDLRWSRTDQAIARLQDSYERTPDSILAPELLYWWGMAVYLKTRSNPEMYAVWDILLDRFPDSIWAARVP
jgi:hypothetical protein